MEQRTEKQLNVEYIPPNFKEGVSVMGFMFKISYAVQALPLIFLVVILLFTVGRPLGGITKLIIALVICAPATVLAVTGINGDSLFGFLKKMIQARRNRNTYIYNPRPKTEIKPLTDDHATREMLPREKIQLFIEKKQAGKDKKKSYTETSFNSMYFEEDEGHAEKPYEYMTAKERRDYNKKDHRN